MSEGTQKLRVAQASIADMIRLVAEAGWEIHYAPMSGSICVMNGDEMRVAKSWPECHELLTAFQEYRACGELVFKSTIAYGHQMFHGHSGRVDIYTWANPSTTCTDKS